MDQKIDPPWITYTPSPVISQIKPKPVPTGCSNAEVHEDHELILLEY